MYGESLARLLLIKIKVGNQPLNVTPMIFNLVISQIIFARLKCNMDGICVGIAHRGRGGDDKAAIFPARDIVGYFTNLLPMRFRDDLNASFGDVRTVRNRVLSNLLHAHMSPYYILESLMIACSIFRSTTVAVSY